MNKISNKIVVAIMLCVVISAAAVGYISARSAEKALSEQVNSNVQSLLLTEVFKKLTDAMGKFTV